MRKFGFLIHPLSYDDVLRYEPKAVGKGMPLIKKILEWMPAYKASHITGVRSLTGEEIEGFFIATPLLPEQWLELPREAAMARVVAGAKLAAQPSQRIARSR